MSYEGSLKRGTTDLRLALHQLTDEFRNYPTPISGCDAQFNHLVAQRTAITDALSALEDLPFVPTPRIPNRGDRVESR